MLVQLFTLCQSVVVDALTLTYNIQQYVVINTFLKKQS